MGKYTTQDNPIVDAFIDNLIAESVRSITERVSPHSVILYGSLARGEASVIVSDNKVQMLSDCEIRVIDPSPRMRKLCAQLTAQLTRKLGVEMSVAWMQPDRLPVNKLFVESPSIFIYELVSAGRTLYGQDLLAICPPIDPTDIPLRSGILLVLNRMAESLAHLPCSNTRTSFSRLENVIWINKTVLACVEALLLSEKAFHYSYQERQRRFSALVSDKFGDLLRQSPDMPDLVCRATKFKLQPVPELYPQDLASVWERVAIMLDVVLRHLLALEFDNSDCAVEISDLHIRNLQLQTGSSSLVKKAIEAMKYLEQKRWPPRILFSPYLSPQVIYALVPVLFQACFVTNQEDAMHDVRKWLKLLGRLPSVSVDPQFEWNVLSQRLAWAWKTFCY